MKPTRNSPTALETYGLIEALEARIAPAAVATTGLLDKAVPISATAGGSIRLSAGEVLTTGSGLGGGLYLMYVEQGQVLVHTTDLNNNNQVDFNEITGLSVSNGARIDVFVDIHGDIATDLNPDFTLTDSDHNASNGLDGRVLLDNNIAAINMRSLQASDFSPTASETSAQIVLDHLAMSSYSIFGNIYAGNGLGVSGDATSGLHIDNSGASLQAGKFDGSSGSELYTASVPQIGSIFVGTAASAQPFSFGANATHTQAEGTFLPFSPAVGEAGASIINVASTTGYNVGILHAGDGGFNAPGGNIVNVALQDNSAGANALIAGNAGVGTTGHVGGSITNFSDTGSITGAMLLQSGNGGKALTGSGGDAGAITFNTAAPIGINAHFQIDYGMGGDGYTGGGNGTGLPAGHFITPEGSLTHATKFVSTMRSIGSIGQTQYIDFNLDGNSDAVYATTNPDQLVVALGDGSASFNVAQKIYLAGPAAVSSITVADFNGDGHPDIAVTSGTPSAGGVQVFFSHYDNHGVFTGFSTPLYVALPGLSPYGFYDTTTAVTASAAGDFTGDGHMDLAVTVHELALGDQQDTAVVIVLSNDGTGHFFADFSNATPVGQFPVNDPFYIAATGATANFILKATALTTFTPGAGHDVLIAAQVGAKSADLLDDSTTSVQVLSTLSFGSVDTDRSSKVAPLPFSVRDLAVTQDVTTPTKADFVAINTQGSFLIGGTGNGTGGFAISTGSGDQAGIPLGTTTKAVAVVAAPNTTNSAYSDAAYLNYPTDGSAIEVVVNNMATSIADANHGPSTAESWPFVIVNSVSQQLVAFDEYNPTYNPATVTTAADFGVVIGIPQQDLEWVQSFGVGAPDGSTTLGAFTYKDAGYFITAGNGGSALDGPGGNGGVIGQALTVTTSNGVKTATGSLSFVFPVDITYGGFVDLTAGNGGNGFKSGGNGGNATGFSVTYPASATLFANDAAVTAGNGGQSLEGVGGAGGNLSQMFVQSGEVFTAGNGGIGAIGGAGGSVIGNKIPGLVTVTSNTETSLIEAFGGKGATGLVQGGNGGNIDTFQTEFLPLVSGTGGFLEYLAGSAGGAVAGHGGAGGSVLNSSPQNFGSTGLDNNLAGDIYLFAGNGGDGLFGGAGGAIQTFVDSPAILQIPTVAVILGGNGGHGTSGAGGPGGSISGISVPTAGISLDGNITYDRMLAGLGGDSSGNGGGQGGSVVSVNSSASAANAQYFVAAGAGGAGLTSGGAGGNVSNATITAGSVTGKVVVVAGDGGASSSVKFVNNANPAAALAASLGGVNGPGGKGGSIGGFTQSGNVDTHVDLIAGNGGATLNHSVAAGQVTKDNSGAGGSISNASVDGDIGNVGVHVAIKSYNDFLGGQTMQQFIESYVIGNLFAPLDDTVGNVGLVAGAGGRVLGGLPSANKVNGSVTNVHARNIESMVAGSVDQVDFIQKLTNYGTTISGGILGADKDVSFHGFPAQIGSNPNQLDYADSNGVHQTTPLPGGGFLIDGAVMAMNIRVIQSVRDFQGTVP